MWGQLDLLLSSRQVTRMEVSVQQPLFSLLLALPVLIGCSKDEVHYEHLVGDD